MTDKKQILFILPSLVAGGAERIISFIAQNINKEVFSPTLLIIGKEEDTAYDVKGIKVIYLKRDRVLHGIIPMFRYIRIHKPNLVVTAIGHLNAVAGILSMVLPKTKFIAREVNVLSVAKTFKKKINPVFALTSKFGYRFLDIIICQSRDMKKDFLALNNVKENKVRLINNPITDGFELHKKIKKNNEFRLITVASLKKQKGHLRILNALSKFNAPFTYTIVGSGSEFEPIMKRINDLDLNNHVVHIPFTKEVPKYLAENDLFLQGAYVEGFPNCLLESCSVGTPILAFNAPGGLDEIINEGINGFIVEDENQFLKILYKCYKGYEWDSKKINTSVTSKFSKEIILKEYENLFLEVIN